MTPEQLALHYRHRWAVEVNGCYCVQYLARFCCVSIPRGEQECGCPCHAHAERDPDAPATAGTTTATVGTTTATEEQAGAPATVGTTTATGTRPGGARRLALWVRTVRQQARCSCRPGRGDDHGALACVEVLKVVNPDSATEPVFDHHPCDCPCHDLIDECLYALDLVGDGECPCGRCSA